MTEIRFRAQAHRLLKALFGRGWKHTETRDMSFNAAYLCVGEVEQINYKVAGLRDQTFAHAFKGKRPKLYIRGDGKAAVLYPCKFASRGFVP